MGPGVAMAATGVVDAEFSEAVHHLVLVCKHAGGQRDLTRFQGIELDLFQGLIGVADLFSDGE